MLYNITKNTQKKLSKTIYKHLIYSRKKRIETEKRDCNTEKDHKTHTRCISTMPIAAIFEF